MKRSILLGSLLLLFTLGSAGASTFETGATLLAGWQEYQRIQQSQPGKRDYLLAARYVGYVAGVADAQAADPRLPKITHSEEDLSVLVGRYLEAHPERLGEPGYGVVVRALREAYLPGR